MEILKIGEIPEKKEKLKQPRIKKCCHCKTIFSYQEEDKELYGNDPDCCFYAVECPLCKVVLPTSIFDRKEKK